MFPGSGSSWCWQLEVRNNIYYYPSIRRASLSVSQYSRDLQINKSRANFLLMGCCCVNNFCNSPMDNSQESNIFLLIKDRIGSDSGYQLTFLLCLASLFSVLAGWSVEYLLYMGSIRSSPRHGLSPYDCSTILVVGWVCGGGFYGTNFAFELMIRTCLGHGNAWGVWAWQFLEFAFEFIFLL